MQIEARVLAVELLAAPMQPRALALAHIEITQVLIELNSHDHRAHFRPGFQRIIDNELLQSIGEPVDEAVVDTRGHDQARGRGATLPGRENGAVHRAIDRDREIGIVEHNERVLPPISS